MLEFIKSTYADAIYYADLFRIHNKIWMIMGYGKSEAARAASNNDRACDLARDCVALKVERGVLYGRYDPGALGAHAAPNSELHTFHKIDYISYCLSPEQTEEIFKNNERGIIQCEQEIMSSLSVIYPYPAYAAQFAFTPSEIENLAAPQRRAEKFFSLISESEFTNNLLIPYMAELEGKANLYITHSTDNV